MLRSAEGNGRQAREPNMASKACLASSARPQHSQQHRMRVECAANPAAAAAAAAPEAAAPEAMDVDGVHADCKKDRGHCNNVPLLPLLCPECIDGESKWCGSMAWQHTMQLSTRIRVWRMGSHLRWVPRK